MSCCAPCAGTDPRATIGDLLPTIVWPGDVKAAVVRLDPEMSATDAAVHACAVDAAIARSWSDFFASWTKWKADASCLFGCANKYSEVQRFEAELSAWQSMIKAHGCGLSSPGVVVPPSSDAAVKWLVVAGVVGAAVYVFGPFVRRALAR